MMQGKLSVTRNLRLGLMLWAAAIGLNACTATGPTKPEGTVTSRYGNYQQVVRNGQTLYCRNEKVTASHFMEEKCLTKEQLDQEEENARRFSQDTQGMPVLPSNPNSH